MGYAWLLFDLDGTLLDYVAAEAAALSATLVAAGLEATGTVTADYRRINAEHWAALERGETTQARLRVARWEDLLALHGSMDIDPSEIADVYVRHLAAGTQLLADAPAVLADLASDHRLALITNGIADVQRPRVAAAGLTDHTDVLVISDEVGAAKPDAAIFDAAFAAMGDPRRDEVLMIGDSLSSDVVGGLAYGLDTVWFNPEGDVVPAGSDVRPTHEIGRLTELPPLVRGRCGADHVDREAVEDAV